MTDSAQLRVDLLTREYPPEVYGGAGVHVEYLARELRRITDVRVHCFGAPRTEPGVRAYAEPAALTGANAALRTMGVDLEMAAGCAGTDVVHSHTWYANLAGHTAKLLYGVPHVATAHSLEPLRPWKAEQLGGGYALSSWCERTAYEAADAIVAVSAGMRRDVLAAYPSVDPDRVHVIYNGIDTAQYAPDPARTCWRDSASTRPCPAWSTSGGSPGRRACRTCCAPPASCRRTPSWCCWPRAGHPGDRRRGGGPGRRAAGEALRGCLGGRDAAQARGDPGAHARHHLRLPVGVRADGHRQPGGDGLRDGGGGHRHRRHPRGGRRRRDRPAGPARPGRPRRHTRRPGTLRGRPGGPPERAAGVSRACRRTRPGRRHRAVEHFSWDAVAARTLDLYRSLLK